MVDLSIVLLVANTFEPLLEALEFRPRAAGSSGHAGANPLGQATCGGINWDIMEV